MKRMLVTVVMAAVVVLAFMPAATKADPPVGTNLIGIYTEASNAGLCNMAAGAMSTVDIYFCLTGCSFGDNGIGAWELQVVGEDASAFIVSGRDLFDGQNFASPPAYIVGTASHPTPNADDFLVLMQMTLFVLDASAPLYFQLAPVDIPSIPGRLALTNGIDDMDLQPADPTAGYGENVFGINSGPLDPPIPVNETTWGGVRNLYR